MDRNNRKKIDLKGFKNALVVDSDSSSLNLIKNYLENSGISNVETFSDGLPAINAVEQNFYDVIVLEWKMKNPLGKDVYQAMRASLRNRVTPIVLISGFVTKEEVQVCIKDKMARFLVKPFTEEIILELIKKMGGIQQKNSVPSDDKALAGDLGLIIQKGSGAPSGPSSYVDKGAGSTPKGDPYIDKASDVGGDFEITQQVDSPTDFEITQQSAGSTFFDGKISQENSKGFEFSESKKNSRNEDFKNKNKFRILPRMGESPKADSNSGTNYSFQHVKKEVTGLEQGKPNLKLEEKTTEIKKILSQIKIFDREFDVYAPGKILVVDNDEAIHGLVESYLKDISTAAPICVVDAAHADQELAKNKYDLVVMDWRQRGMSGLTLYNRLRSRLINKDIPIVVLTGLVGQEDFRILSENSNSLFVSKPTEIQGFQEVALKVITSARESVVATECIEAILNRINDQPVEIMRFAQNAANFSDNPGTYLNVLGAILVKKKQLELAESIYKLVFEKDKKNLTAMTELSKIFYRSGRTSEAELLLSRAVHLSPESIERLCLLGEIGLTLKDTEKARAYFKNALNIDHEDLKAKAGLKLADNMTEHLQTVEHGHDSLSNILASNLNTIGISYIKRKEIEKGIEQYKAALCFIYDDPTLSKLHFNLGLAYMRQHNAQEAKNWFLTAKTLSSEIDLKADRYLNGPLILKKR